jgi:hypothetical protein
MKVALSAVLAATVCAGGLSVAAAASDDQAQPNARRGHEHARFGDPQPNRWFPLEPGTVSRYRGTDEGRRFTERVVVTSRTKVVDGVTTTMVRDVVRHADGSVAERTRDWYATDDTGNVWYFGEDTATYDRRGRVESREGSWQAGVDGAVAGMIMPADPAPTDAYRQEYARGSAEDQAWIVQQGVTSTVPYGTVHGVVRSLEWSRLEKDVVSAKLYAPGLGIVREEDLSGGDETFVLVSVHRR